MASSFPSSTAGHHHHHRHYHHHHHRRSSSSSNLRRAQSTDDAAAAGTAAAGAGGLLTLEVSFLDNSTRAFSLPRSATAGDLTRAIVERLGLGEAVAVEDVLPFFGLVESYTGTTLDRPVHKAEPLSALVPPTTTSTDSHTHHHSGHSSIEHQGKKLVFLLRAPGFPCLRRLSLADPALLYHRYIQAVHAVVTGLLPCLPQQDYTFVLRLACLQLCAKLAESSCSSGDSSSSSSKGVGVGGPAFACALGNRIVEYIPSVVFKARRAAEWREGMAALLEIDPNLHSLSESETQQAYLALVEPLPLFGSTLFPGATADPGTAQAREVVLAVDGAGLAVYDPVGLRTGAPPMNRVSLEEMGQWGFYPQGQGLFYFTQKDGEKTEVVNYGTGAGAAVCEALTTYAYGFLKDAELEGRVEWEGGVGGDCIPLEEEGVGK